MNGPPTPARLMSGNWAAMQHVLEAPLLVHMTRFGAVTVEAWQLRNPPCGAFWIGTGRK